MTMITVQPISVVDHHELLNFDGKPTKVSLLVTDYHKQLTGGFPSFLIKAFVHGQASLLGFSMATLARQINPLTSSDGAGVQ